ncbi:hypothetical protein D9758_002672 [Tetrapyrgos nigripes]|uniref:NudC domain-containing protein 1 n=1 Tax=Tetrapyrgos nigripes TaxID=182062 RepID=A0A8H5GQX4_9AGAR|nr:hypothetical protein D9758_002672 [Tetrapyrgos nigripes]
MDIFTVNRKLLNSNFEGYKLDLVDQDQVISRFPLELGASQSTISSRTLLSFQEVQSKISHNHLAVSPENYAIYVDEAYRVIQISIAPDTLLPSARVVYELPKPIRPSSDEYHPEYPSAAFASQGLLILSDGYGLMYILRCNPDGQFILISTYQLERSNPDRPFLIHSASSVDGNTAVVILSSRSTDSQKDQTASALKASERTPSRVEFDVYGVRFDVSSLNTSENISGMDVLWNRRGDEVPIYTGYNPHSQAFFLIGGSSYRSLQSPPPPSYTPSADEIAPIPRPNEDLDAEKPSYPPKPPPYSWTQTSDSVTVAFPLPSSISKSGIHVKLTSEALSLSVDGDPSAITPLPKYTSKALWDRISPSSSYWTWDKEAEHSFGCLTLHLDKQHEGTKWMQVFASAGTKPASESDPEDVEVPETLDPSEIWHIREALEKYTAALTSGEDASGLGLGKGVPGLAEGEMDEEVDSTVGRMARVSWVGFDGASPSWYQPGREQPIQLLSVPFPGTPSSSLSLIMKEGVDGVVFALGSDTTPKWSHTKSFSALSFVLASKQDVKFTYHTSDLVFAFENGLRDRGGNVYVYQGTTEKWAKQAILRLGDGAGGSLLGVGMVEVQGKRIVIALAEKELITLRVWH